MDGSGSLSCGQVVASKSGRDKGKLFVVIKVISDEYVMLSDGDLRKIEKPKKKNVKHVSKHNMVLTGIAEKIKNEDKIENIDLRRVLEPLEIQGLHEEEIV